MRDVPETIPVHAPVFSEQGKLYSYDRAITLTCSPESTICAATTIHYTTNGTDPTAASPEYAGPIDIKGHGTLMTLKAVACHPVHGCSSVVSETYIIEYDQVIYPQLSPQGGTFPGEQAIEFMCHTPGAKIVYTTNGSDPGLGGQEIDCGGILMQNFSAVIKAYAKKEDMLDSDLVIYEFTITGSLPAPENMLFHSANGITTVSWNDMADDEDGYRIYISSIDMKPSYAITRGADSEDVRIYNLKSGTEYHFWIQAFRGDDFSIK